jgi:hypothetical protein
VGEIVRDPEAFVEGVALEGVLELELARLSRLHHSSEAVCSRQLSRIETAAGGYAASR